MNRVLKNQIVTYVLTTFFLVLSLWAWIRQPDEFSDSERRQLAAFPEVSMKSISSGEFMEDFEKQEGIAFFLLYYTAEDVLYYLRFQELKKFWDRAASGGRKSFRFDELNPTYVFSAKKGLMVPYLDMIQMDLNERDE